MTEAVKYAVAGVLGLSGLARLAATPAFVPPKGPKKNLSARYLRVPGENGILCQVIYPCDTSKEGKKQYAPSEYTRYHIREAMGSRFFVRPMLAHLALMRTGHPCGSEGCAPEAGKFPVVIFSHGLFGNADFYVDIAIHLASLG